MNELSDNFTRIRTAILDAEKRYQRPPGSVTLLAVSKSQDASALFGAIDLGHYCFAENYLQELKKKQQALASNPWSDKLKWHFIGTIQSKKERHIAQLCDWVHSVDRMKIARSLSKHRLLNTPLNVCIQVNVDNEQSKSGIQPDDMIDFAKEIAALPNLRLRGLMAIPKPQPDFVGQRASFANLKALYDELASSIPSVDSLSAGMSNDFEAAIAEGATMVRIGTALFGPRKS